MKQCAIVLVIAITFTFGLAGYKLFLSISHPIKYKNEITQIATENDLSPSLVASIINIESGYNPNAKSNKGAIGLMQIKLSTANYLCEIYNLENTTENELFEPITNLKFGCLYLKYLSKKFKNVNTVLASYNAGETRVRTWLNSKNYSIDGKTLSHIPYSETRNYVKKFKNNMNFYSKIYKN